MQIKADPKKLKEKIKPIGNNGKLFQCRIDQNLLEQVQKKKQIDHVSWREIIEAAFDLYLKS